MNTEENREEYSSHFIRDENQRTHKKDIRWFKEMINFDTLREAEQWVYNGDAFNKIRTEFEGYITGDPKLAFALLYNLTRENTLNQRFNGIFADEEYKDGHTLYMIWVN
ncbi:MULTISPECIES: hypothetical protein [unclassified Paenibacillus]|uniref:hypothetical protein n=1 Tax=unclassified Paenibacillus TaxID=185978 RepID=UPI0024071FB0|nr:MULTISPECIES: hypothetical protein [unclassified Paenibacillus]MDF9839418.1 hypothetical protein [Paenibacillus sp. PastF-2]MDF9845998.1 hypothetical protein [Paenibacillus sp. PastM-2]MDF9852571.1 hypothetical protein [Paenibacillus sp. PastF-1]MDH6477699.1 hypothetical protein [Paenibacillus sp. PastH-2]MDH6505438.1 hypothetical protein [Paenibacillus sp. PastM-3]